ncbi:hypothetical protein SOVF_038900 isoform A [Spinacia oleracea]|uniref:Uncharacterized protein isoform X2 n=1 Tax=Spinacia oleracea TaxID=3562 RepID=A0A9R0IRF0_SPIOL|nr:uncharacterized protein LOC110792376 isoform X2 [Spinacia oleracea]KNA21902.1 hypothetical protein SOVF_038900 isoform A [Spinacia oleracea]
MAETALLSSSSSSISASASYSATSRCETILQPGLNCTIRIEKNRAKNHRRSKTKTPTQNNVVYTCQFCLHRNLKRGTPKGYMRELTPSKPKSSNPKPVKKSNFSNVKTDKPSEENNSTVKTEKENEKNFSNVETDKANEAPSPSPAITNICSSVTDNPTSSLAESGVKLLDSKRRKRKKPGLKASTEENQVSSAPAVIEKDSGASKRRKKSWTTLKDIAESEKHDRNQRFTNFSIPFNL